MFIALTPPFQVPDEPAHFYRAWQISEGQFYSVKKDQRVGGELPAALSKFSNVFAFITWYGYDFKYTQAQLDASREITDYRSERVFTDFNNTALYSPVCYLPAATGIFIFRSAAIPLLYIFYAGRLFTLLFWVFAIYFAIKFSPVYKWLFCLLALLPMSIFINSSLSADVVTNALCFYFIAFIFYLRFNAPSVNARYILFLSILIFLVTSVKAIYSPIILLLLIIPVEKYKNRKDQVLKTAGMFLVALFSTILWSTLMNKLYITYQEYHPAFRDKVALVNGADMKQQMDYIKDHGTYIFEVIFHSLGSAFKMYVTGYIGTFGWVELPLPQWLVCLCYILITVVAITDADDHYRFLRSDKLLFFGLFCFILFMVFLSQHLIWDPVGGDRIGNIQGRYLIPFAPLLFISLYQAKKNKNAMPSFLVILTGISVLSYSAFLLYGRYFN